MKKSVFVLFLSVAGALWLTGCGDCCSSSATGGSGGASPGVAAAGMKWDTAAVEKAFASAESNVRSAVDKAIATLKNADYAAAGEQFKKVLDDVKITEEQKKALSQLLGQIQTAASKAAGEAYNSARKTAEKAVQDFKAGASGTK